MKIDREKYTEAILYFAHGCNNEHLGKTKMMKLLYFLDFDHFEQYGQPVTGDRYFKREFGPVPLDAETMFQLLERENLIERITASVYGYTQQRVKPLRDPDLSVFSESELATLSSVCKQWKDATRHEIIEATHDEEPWIAVDDGEEIPYVYAYYRDKFPSKVAS